MQGGEPAAPYTVGAAGAANQPHQPPPGHATRIPDIDLATTRVAGVRGVVRAKRGLRQCVQSGHRGGAGGGGQQLGGAVDDGPLAALATTVVSCTLHGIDGAGLPNSRIQVFFYDKWADEIEGCLENGYSLTLTGPGCMVRAVPAGDHPCALLVAPPALLSDVASLGAPSTRVRVDLKHPEGAELNMDLDLDQNTMDARVEAFKSTCARRGGGRGGKEEGRVQGSGGKEGNRGGRGTIGGGVLMPTRKYEYSKCGEIRLERDSGKEINIWAMVGSFGQPRATNGTDFSQSFLLVDETTTDADTGLVCNIFRPAADVFPKVRAVGELLRCHRVKVKEYQGRPQLVGPGQVHRSQYVVARRKPGAGPVGSEEVWEEGKWELEGTSENFTFDESDKLAILSIWRWREMTCLPSWGWIKQDFNLGPKSCHQIWRRLRGEEWQPALLPSFLPPGGETEQPSVSTMIDQPGDFVAMLINKNIHEGAFCLWDGTGCTAATAAVGVGVSDAVGWSVRRAALKAIAGPKWGELREMVTRDLVTDSSIGGRGRGEGGGGGGGGGIEGGKAEFLPPVMYSEDLPSAVGFQEGVRRHGCWIVVRVAEEHKWRLAQLNLPVGGWVRMKGLTIAPFGMGKGGGRGEGEELWAGLNASVNPMPEEGLEVHRVAVRLLYRLREEQHRASVAVREGKTAPCMELFVLPPPARRREHRSGFPRSFIVEALGSSPMTFFAVRARIIGWWPQDLRKFCTHVKGQWIYIFTLRLQDTSGEMDVVVNNEVGEWFFSKREGTVRAWNMEEEGKEGRAKLKAMGEILEEYKRQVSFDFVVKSYLVGSAGEEGGRGGGRGMKRFRLLQPNDYKT